MNGKKEHWIGNKIMIDLEKEKKIPDEFKQLAKDFADKGFITTSFDN